MFFFYFIKVKALTTTANILHKFYILKHNIILHMVNKVFKRRIQYTHLHLN